MPPRRSKLSLNQRLVLSLMILTILATLMAAFLSGHDWFRSRRSPGVSQEIQYVGHVMDANTLHPIANAKITLTLEGAPTIVYADNEGIYRFRVMLQSNLRGQIRVDAQGYQVYIRNITISPTLNRIDDLRLSPAEAMSIETASSEPNGPLAMTTTPALSDAISVVNNFYRWINDAQSRDDFKKAWELETSGSNGLQCREASACLYSKFQDSWWLWKVQYKLYDCGSNLVDAELRYYRRDPGIANASVAPEYVRYQLVEVAGELRIDRGQTIGSPGTDCTLEISIP